jgi:hypothetical protein
MRVAGAASVDVSPPHAHESSVDTGRPAAMSRASVSAR